MRKFLTFALWLLRSSRSSSVTITAARLSSLEMQLSPSSPAGLFSPNLRGLSVGLSLSILMIAFESLAVSTVLPSVAKELDGQALYGWSFSAFFLGYLVSTVTLGGLADRDGPKQPYAAALTLFGVGLLIAGLAPNMPVFVLGRGVQGLGGGAIGAIAYLAINRAYPDQIRAAMLSLLSSAWVLPALVGPLAASLIAQAFSWRTVFLGLLPLALIAALITLPALSRLSGHGKPLEQQRVVLAIAVAIGAVLTLSALQAAQFWLAALMGISGVSLMLPALLRLLPAGTLRLEGALQAGMVVRFLLTFAFLGAEVLVPLALGELRGLTLTEAGLVLSVGALSWSFGSVLQSRLDSRSAGRSRAGLVRIGFALLSMAMLGMLAVSLLPIPAWLSGVAWLVGGLGMGFAFPAHTLVVFANAPSGEEGKVSGNLQMVDVLGAALSAGIGGALIAQLGLSAGFAVIYATTVCAALLGIAVAGKLVSRAI